MLAFSGRFSRKCLEGISFKFFVCFIFNVSLGSAPKRKNFDIQRNTRVGSGGQFTSNRLSCHLNQYDQHNCTKTYKVGRGGLKPNLATSYRPFKPSEANNAPFHMWEMKILNEGKKPNKNKQNCLC